MAMVMACQMMPDHRDQGGERQHPAAYLRRR